MLRKWRKNNHFISDLEFNTLLSKIQSVATLQKDIVFTPNNTGSNWLGVKNASVAMFPNNVIILPQNYSNTLLSKDQTNAIINEIVKARQTQIIFSGIPNYTYDWMNKLNQKKVKVGVIFHGGLAELAGNQQAANQMKKLLEYANNGIVSKVGVVKEGLDEWFHLKIKASVYKLHPVFTPPSELKFEKYNDGHIHIGIFGNGSYNKNRHTQVAAASLIENSIVHIIEPNEFEYCLPKERIKTYSMLNYKDFLELIGQMDISLYCSFSESWGQVVLESLYMNTPCLFSNNSGIDQFIGDQYLIQDYDNPSKIAKQITKSLASEFSKIDFSALNQEFKVNNGKFIS